ncbi:hypothetical protein FACS1894108_15260 [Planctomycetales bacterium]|nr:hypothetical protein FACS1894108_15260 [Planctomycetales bacterium]
MLYAPIVTFDEIDRLRPTLGKIVGTSGGFDPLHPGHATCIVESKKYGDTLVVIVNGDAFLRTKKGKPFQDLATRCRIVSCLRAVDYVVPFEIENDQTVCEALRRLRPHYFTKGGDRSRTMRKMRGNRSPRSCGRTRAPRRKRRQSNRNAKSAAPSRTRR